MNLRTSVPILGAVALCAAHNANAALLIQLDFDSDPLGSVANGGTILNAGTSGINATASVTGGTLTIASQSGGNFLNITPDADTLEAAAAPHLSTGSSIATLGIAGDQNYTMMAWVRFANQTGDNMIFGGTSGDVLHNGSRDANYHSGHWGDDLQGGTTDPGNWHHVTFTNTAAGLQEIFVDGMNVASGAGAGTGGYTPNSTETLLIGSSRNGGSFNGDLDDVRVYDEVLDQAAIDAIVAAGIPTSRQLLIHYTFDTEPVGALSNGATVANSGSSGTDGAAGVPGGSLTVIDDINRVKGDKGALGNYLVVQPSSDADSGTNATHISTGSSLDDLGFSGDAPYTMMAWVRFDNQIGDNMVFGGDTGAVLQLGSRGDDYISGHSGDDIDSADMPNTETGSWHHIAWTNGAIAGGDNSGAQEIYVDGVSVAGPGATTVVSAINANLTEILLVGSSVNGGSFRGALDDIRVYDGFVSPTEINQIIDAATLPPVNLGNLVVHYTFDTEPVGAVSDGATIANSGFIDRDGVAGVPDGTLTILNDDNRVNGAGGLFGSYLDIQPSADNLEGIAAPHISTESSITELAIAGDQNYTAMAWVRFDNQTGDNMIFGGTLGDVMHHGSRDATYHSGHWGDDLQGGTTDPGNWHHVTYTNTEAGLQEIFVDGASVGSGAEAGTGGYTNNADEILLVGTSRNGGSLRGALDDVRIYDSVLTKEEIEAIINSTTATPEDFRVTQISHDAENDMVTLTFTSTPGRDYTLLWTPDLQDGPVYTELDDGILAHETASETTITRPIPVPIPNPGGEIPKRVFLILRENPLPPP